MSTLETNLIQPSTGTALTVGASGDTITVPSGATFNVAGTLQSGGSAITQGITMADQWRLSANTNSGTNADVTSNWERNDTTGYGSIGTGLTESSGIFSFPSTGIYLIIFTGRIQNAASDTSSNFSLYVTTDNSSYNEVGVVASGNGSSNAVITGSSNTFLFDVTSTTTHKFKFVTASFSTGTFLTGGTDLQRTGLTVIRLGDT
jgi:hypothetical protein